MTRVLVVSVVPSPYQRDIFRALAARPEVVLEVRYMEPELKGYPWPQEPFERHERVLPGWRVDTGKLRVHWNRELPKFDAFDVVVFNTYLTSITAQWAMRRCGARHKWVFWGERLRPQTTVLRQWIQDAYIRVLRGASGIAAIGKLAAKGYAARFPAVPVFNIPYHCTLERFLRHVPAAHERSKPLTFLFCGILNERKGLDLLLRAFERLVSVGRDVNLILVGQTTDNRLPSVGVSEEARRRVRWEGFCKPDALPEIFARADVFVLPSRHDGWGVVMNQALGAGLALIGSHAAGAAHDLIEPGYNGLLFETSSVPDLVRCMDVFAADPATAAEWGKRSHEMASGWTPAAGAAKWVSALEQIVGHS